MNVIDDFMNLVQNNFQSCDNLRNRSLPSLAQCIDSGNIEKIKELFSKFLAILPPMKPCEKNSDNYFECPFEGNSGDFLQVIASSYSGFGMEVVRSEKNVSGGLKQGLSLKCTSVSSAIGCRGALPSDENSVTNFYTKKEEVGDWQETYRHLSPEGDPIAYIESSSSTGSSCKGRIFDKFFTQSLFKEVPFSSYAKIGLGIAAAAYLSYKAYQEVQKSRKEKSGATVQKLNEKQVKAHQEAEKYAKIYGVAALVFGVCVAMTYFTDFSMACKMSNGAIVS